MTIRPNNKPGAINYRTVANKDKAADSGSGGGCDVVVSCDSVSNFRSANDLFRIPTIGYDSFSSLFNAVCLNADRMPVNGSTCIRSIGIDDNGRLEIEFQNRGVYQYDCHGVEPAVMSDILDADSRGQFYCGHVRGQYPSYKVKGGLTGINRNKPLAKSGEKRDGKILDWRESFEKPVDVNEKKMSKFQRILHGLGLLRSKSDPVPAREGDWSDID